MNRLILPIKKGIQTSNTIGSTSILSVQLPGSKYIANRLLPLCVLASTPSSLNNLVENDDIYTAIEGLTQLGYGLRWKEKILWVQPKGKQKKPSKLSFELNINTHHSGTFSRFISALAALENYPIHIKGSKKMSTRPMEALFSALRELGAKVQTKNERLPVLIQGPIIHKHCQLDPHQSSQYLSALLIIAPLLKDGLTIQLTHESVSYAYIKMTIDLMKKMGVSVQSIGKTLHVESGQSYHGLDYSIPPDPVSSSYFMAFSAISGQAICIDPFDHHSLQGESRFYTLLEQMGVRCLIEENRLTLLPQGILKGIDIDMSEMPDVVQTLSVIAAHAQGITHIRNIAHLAYKESNRIEDTANELRKAGIYVESGADFLVIHGGTPHACSIKTYDDHRMAMSMALLGIQTENIFIQNSSVVNKSFPHYWDLMANIGLHSKII
jgi:3-phosphoshikimate 1-carboxyvinyltransferase